MGTTIAIIVAAALGFAMFGVGFLMGRRPDSDVLELTDTLKPGVKRSNYQVLQDGVMQLKNEIALSGAVKRETLEDGTIRVSIKVLL